MSETTMYSVSTIGIANSKQPGMPIGFDGSPAGAAVLVDLDKVRSRAHLLELFAAAKAAVLDGEPEQR